MFSNENIKKVDPAIAEVLDKELERQNSHIELIASENWVNDAILEAAGSILTNKYAEGYPGKRYYGGCEVVDEAERLAIERTLWLRICKRSTSFRFSSKLCCIFRYLKAWRYLYGYELKSWWTFNTWKPY